MEHCGELFLQQFGNNNITEKSLRTATQQSLWRHAWLHLTCFSSGWSEVPAVIQVSSFNKESIYLGEIVGHDCELESQMTYNVTEVFRCLLQLYLVPLHWCVFTELVHRFLSFSGWNFLFWHNWYPSLAVYEFLFSVFFFFFLLDSETL